MDANSINPQVFDILPDHRYPKARYIGYFEEPNWPEFVNQYPNIFNWTISSTSIKSDIVMSLIRLSEVFSILLTLTKT